MFFLSPILLWFLTAASVPVIIHLINRRRHKTIRWAAMQFLLKAAKESRGKKKLRHILILTCRALGVAALALAAARPIVSGLIGWGGGSIDTVVLLLDRSPSMEIKPADGQPSRRELVLAKVREAMAGLDGGARLVLIDSATGVPQEVPSPDVLDTLSACSATDAPADFPTLLNRAAEFLTDLSGRSEIWLASDLQAASWRPDDERWSAARARLAGLPQQPVLRVLSLGGNTAANLSLRILGSRRTGDELLLDLEVLRAVESRGNASVPMSTHLNGSTTSETLTVSGQSFRFQKRIALPAGSDTGYGWVSIPADGNPRDNAAFFAFGPSKPMKTLVVAPPGEAASYLELAAAPPGLGGLAVQCVDPSQAEAAIRPDLAAVIWAAPLPAGSVAAALHQYLSPGGQVLFVAPAVASDTSFNEVKWGAPMEAPSGKFFILKEWNRDDGPLRDGMDGTPVSGGRLKALVRQIAVGETMPLARWEDSEPFLSRRIFDHGTAWFLGSTPDYKWSNLADADVLLPLVQRIIQAGNDRFDASYLAMVGSERSRLAPGEVRTRLDEWDTHGASGGEHDSGVYRLGERLIALNRPLEEDAPEVLTPEVLDRVLEGTRYTLLDQEGRHGDPSDSRDVWRLFLIAVLLFFLAEALLCLPKKHPVEALPQKPAVG